MTGRRQQILFFDLVGTLIRGSKPIGEQYAEHARVLGVTAEPALLQTAFREAMAEAGPMAFPGRSFDETAALERRWWSRRVQRVVERAGLSARLSGETFERFFSALYDHFTTAAAWELYPDVLPTLRRLHSEGDVLGLITNYDTRVFALLEALGLSSHLSPVVIPAHVGAAKPDRAIFAHALERVDAKASCALHIGDDIDDDYRGAEGAGLRAVLIDRTGKFRGQDGVRRIESLSCLSLEP